MLVGQPAMAASEPNVFRTIAFICSGGANGTAAKTVENIVGERLLYKVTYFDHQAILFVVTRALNGTRYRTVKSIDLRSETNKRNLEIARKLAAEMDTDATRYCQGGQPQIDARYELTANHEFNRSHARYRGK
jgi:hypothetical protein